MTVRMRCQDREGWPVARRRGSRQALASLVLTDPGGIQEETTYLGTSCLAAFREVAHRQGTPQ